MIEPTTKRYFYLCRWCKQQVDTEKRIEHNRQMEHRKGKKHAVHQGEGQARG